MLFLLLLLTEIHTILLKYAGMAEPGGQGGVIYAPPVFGRSVSPILTMGAHTVISPDRTFKKWGLSDFAF